MQDPRAHMPDPYMTGQPPPMHQMRQPPVTVQPTMQGDPRMMQPQAYGQMPPQEVPHQPPVMGYQPPQMKPEPMYQEPAYNYGQVYPRPNETEFSAVTKEVYDQMTPEAQ